MILCSKEESSPELLLQPVCKLSVWIHSTVGDPFVKFVPG